MSAVVGSASAVETKKSRQGTSSRASFASTMNSSPPMSVQTRIMLSFRPLAVQSLGGESLGGGGRSEGSHPTYTVKCWARNELKYFEEISEKYSCVITWGAPAGRTDGTKQVSCSIEGSDSVRCNGVSYRSGAVAAIPVVCPPAAPAR